MNNSNLLQTFLLINVFIIGSLVTVAIQHAIAHFKHLPAGTTKPHPTPAQAAHLPPEVRAKLLQTAQVNFQNVLDHSATELARDLKTTSDQLTKKLDKIGMEVVDNETKRYHDGLEQLLAKTESDISAAQGEIVQHQTDLKTKLSERQTELETKLAQDIAAEKDLLTKQIDDKLADAVASFLVETLQHNIDLGAQSAYLTSMLEEHKDEIAKGIADEA